MENMAEDDESQTSPVAPKSLAVIQEMITAFSKLFEDASSELSCLHEIFAQKNRIWPDQYKNARTFLYKIHRPVHQFRSLLESPSTLPTGVISQRYPLLMVLQNVEHQVESLLSLISELIDYALFAAKNNPVLQKEASRLFGEIERSYADLRLHTRALLEKIATQTRQSEGISLDRKRALLLQNAISNEKLGEEASEQGRKEVALAYFKRALELIKKAGEPRREVSILNNLGRMYSVLGWKDDACKSLGEALVLARTIGARAEEMLILNNMSLVYTDLGHGEEALKLLQPALLFYQENHDAQGEGRVYNTMGVIYQYLNETELALQQYTRALKIRQASGDRKGQGITLVNLGWAYNDMEKKVEARVCYDEALKISRELQDRWSEGKILSNLGHTSADLGQDEEALHFCEQALAILTEVGDLWEVTRVLNNLVRVYSKLGEKQLAERYSKRVSRNTQDMKDRRGEGQIQSYTDSPHTSQDDREQVNR